MAGCDGQIRALFEPSLTFLFHSRSDWKPKGPLHSCFNSQCDCDQKARVIENQTNIIRNRIGAYLFVGIGLTLGYAFLRGAVWQGSATLHTVMEAVATLLALTVGTMALVRYYSKKNNTFLFIGTGFLGTALLDGYHAVVTSAAFKPFMPTDLPHLIPWSWVASRQFLAVFLFLSWIAWMREQRLGEAGRVGERSVYLFTAFFTLVSFIFFAFAPLPRAYYPEYIFHRPEEFLPALFFLAALVGYLRKGEWRHDIFEHWLVLSLIVGLVGQAAFMSFSGTLFDIEFDVAHTLKKVSYVCVLAGLLANMYVVFKLEAERVEANDLMNLIAVSANQSSDIEDTFTTCLKQICSFMSWDSGHVYLPLEDGSGRLKSSGCWYSSDDERFGVFRDASFKMICQDGLIGQVFKSASPHCIADVTEDPNFIRAAVAAETGLQGSIAFPISVRNETVAVFEFYSVDPIEAVQYPHDILEHASSQIGHVVERFRMERELVGHRDHLQERVTLATQELKLQAEELADALSKEKELNELQRQFVSMASHEFRTPLTIIDGAAQRLKRRIDKGCLTPEDTVQRIDKIRNAVKRMTRLMESTLTASRLQEGKIGIEIGPCEIGKIVKDVCVRQQDIVQTHVISCELAEIPETILADTDSVEQVLTNLLSNAVKYSPEAQIIEVRAWREGHQVVFSVRDYGIGIDEEEFPEIGQRFFRAKTSTGITGTGIGLNLVKTLVEMHGGTVNFESIKGEGSTFTVHLPITGPEQLVQADAKVA